MFHKVVWQHTQSVVGPIITTFPANLLENVPVKVWKSVNIWRIVAMSMVCSFLAHPLYILNRQRAAEYVHITI